jgi:predicted metal-dependent phosphoesterase TrpH
MTRQLLEGRDNRNPKIIQRLQELNVAITMEEVENESGGTVIGRPHIAAILQRKGYVSSIQEAFNKYLAPGGLAYFDKERLAPRRALEMIRDSGGIPVLAHPVQLRTENDGQLDLIVKNLIDQGLEGIEVYHSDHTAELADKYQALARRYKLLTTGGSDFHGTNKKDIQLGSAHGKRVPRELLDGLLQRLAGRSAMARPA